MPAPFNVSVNCTRSPTAKAGLAVLGRERVVGAKLAALAPNRAQILVQRIDILVRIGEHKSRGAGIGGRVLLPLLDQLRSRVVLAVRPDHRLIAREGAQRLLEPALR